MVRAKYFIAHLLKGEAARYHRSLTQTLSDRFHIVPLHRKAPPHITVKIPFEASLAEIAGVEHVLQRFVEDYPKQPFTIEGFGRFGHRTVYLDAQHSREAVLLVRECISELNKLPWMQTVEHEGNKLHASIARFLTPRQFRRIWRMLKHEQPHFKAEFDSLAILKKTPDEPAWHVYREFVFSNEDQPAASIQEKNLLQLHR